MSNYIKDPSGPTFKNLKHVKFKTNVTYGRWSSCRILAILFGLVLNPIAHGGGAIIAPVDFDRL